MSSASAFRPRLSSLQNQRVALVGLGSARKTATSVSKFEPAVVSVIGPPVPVTLNQNGVVHTETPLLQVVPLPWRSAARPQW